MLKNNVPKSCVAEQRGSFFNFALICSLFWMGMHLRFGSRTCG